MTTDKNQPTFETPDGQPPVSQEFTITASAGPGGTIAPAGNLTVSKGSNQRFTITPDSGYTISDVKVDGISVGIVGSYTFENITENHTINAVFSVSADPIVPSWPSPPANPVVPSAPGSSITEQTPGNPETVTVTDPLTGTVTETTTYADGSQTVVETKPDGTVTTTKEHSDGSAEITIQMADGSRSTTTVDVRGKVSSVIALPADIVTVAQNTSSVIPLPMPIVSVTKDSINAPTITLDADAAIDPVKVEIPIANVTAGTVAVLIKEDGTEEVIKKSVTSTGGLILYLKDGATVKVMDRSKTFTDVGGHWSADAVAFVSARDLFTGTSADIFSPNVPVTRAMLATVLARLDGVDTTGGVTWYEKGIEWAMENGVSDGSNPEHEITREQMAVMLYRYAGSPVVSGNLAGYADVDEVSNYALAAVQWAVEQEIITGKPGNMLDAKGSATRAEMAAILMRFCSKMV